MQLNVSKIGVNQRTNRHVRRLGGLVFKFALVFLGGALTFEASLCGPSRVALPVNVGALAIPGAAFLIFVCADNARLPSVV